MCVCVCRSFSARTLRSRLRSPRRCWGRFCSRSSPTAIRKRRRSSAFRACSPTPSPGSSPPLWWRVYSPRLRREKPVRNHLHLLKGLCQSFHCVTAVMSAFRTAADVRPGGRERGVPAAGQTVWRSQPGGRRTAGQHPDGPAVRAQLQWVQTTATHNALVLKKPFFILKISFLCPFD